tara:strand:- start:80 stop:403 length:324 start_codon:yes stop_codon:yes gene_type:complete
MYQLVKGDQAPQIQATLTRDDSGDVVAFSGGSCSLKFRAKGTKTVLFTLVAADVGNNFQNGIAIFGFAGDQLEINSGYYEGEIKITYSTGIIETVSKVLDFELRDDF